MQSFGPIRLHMTMWDEGLAMALIPPRPAFENTLLAAVVLLLLVFTFGHVYLLRFTLPQTFYLRSVPCLRSFLPYFQVPVKIIDTGREVEWPTCWGHTLMALYLEVVYPTTISQNPLRSHPPNEACEHQSANRQT